MTKVSAIALAAVLFGLPHHGAVGAPPSHHVRRRLLPGCHPTWQGSGATFSMVSYTHPKTETESCTSTTVGCINGSREVTTNVRENYECTSDDWCNDSGRQPGSVHEGMAWTRGAKCDSSITPSAIIPNEWDEGGCPDAYAAGADYSEGDAVSVNFGSYKMVYTCVSGDYSAFCGASGYEPGTSIHWTMAWTEQGSYTGTLVPTGSPNFEALEDQGGCPEEYSTGTVYEEMDKVSIDGFVYQCKGYPASGWCGNAGYVPGDEDSIHWPDAWTLLGYCSGTITPTESPNFDTLEDLGPCPKEWMENNDGEAFEEGDRIAVGELVFQCKGWPMGLHCNQAGYVPNDGDASTAGAWKDAWTLVGYCDGTMGPTESPVFDILDEVGDGCPEDYSASNAANYGYGDQVAVTVSDDPDRKVLYECKPWPLGDYCANSAENMRPGEQYGNLGLILKGHCTGTISPTPSPTKYAGICTYTKTTVNNNCNRNQRAANDNPGSTACSCTDDSPPGAYCTMTTLTYPDVNNWSNSVTYAKGDFARVGLDRYKCKVAGWCNQKAYEPVVADIWMEAWAKDGECEVPYCRDIVPGDASESLGIKVTLVNSVPSANTGTSDYNLAVAEKIHGQTIIIDQKEGILWAYDAGSDQVTEIYDILQDDLPVGVELDGITRPVVSFNAGGVKKIQSVSAGVEDDEVFVVFTSTTLPDGASALSLPNSEQYQLFNDGDCSAGEIDNTCGSRESIFDGPYCCTAQKAYKLFYKFEQDASTGRLVNPELIFAHEMQMTYGHDGGAMLTVPDGRILWAVGDCLPFGWNGLDAPQDPNSHCGKILLIDPNDPGSYEIAAYGVRNSQLMFLEGDNVVFMDIGGVTAEEVNSIPLADLLDTSEVSNFGWGQNGDNFAREGTFLVDEGEQFGSFGIHPPCLMEQTSRYKKGFISPYLQFGNAAGAQGFFAVSSAVSSSVSFDSIKVGATEFNSGVFIAGFQDFNGSPTPAFHVKMYKDDGAGGLEELVNGFQDLVADFLTTDPGRGDPRLFRYPDGTAGVLIERTGAFYELEEISVP